MKKSGRREKRKCHVAASRVPVRTAFLFALIVMTRQVCMYVNVRWVMEVFTTAGPWLAWVLWVQVHPQIFRNTDIAPTDFEKG